jgi:CO dehydrogenase/acetyl-CoA synthase gamma subunit (corrinoid Fe-S protein)
MISQVARSTWLAVAIAISSSAVMSARAEDGEKDLPALAAGLKDTKVRLEDGLKASEREGTPVSAKFETDDGKLQLSVYTMMADGFTEVVIDPKTGAIAKAEKITDAEDLEAAAAQKAAMEKATISLLAATQKAVAANAGYQAVSITPEMKEGHPTADITLLQGEAVKDITEKLD